jgi:hypothetical protein
MQAQREAHADGYPRQAAPQPAARPKKPAGPVPVEVVGTVPRALGAQPAPWWFSIPAVLAQAFHVLFVPFKLLVWACEIAVSLVFTGMIAVILLWWFQVIPDSDVWVFVNTLSGRLQNILKGAGLM